MTNTRTEWAAKARWATEAAFMWGRRTGVLRWFYLIAAMYSAMSAITHFINDELLWATVLAAIAGSWWQDYRNERRASLGSET